jgi:calcium/proton exchanger cax
MHPQHHTIVPLAAVRYSIRILPGNITYTSLSTSKLLAFATEELAMRLNQTLAELINATLGNAVELIVAILALVKCNLQIVQSLRTFNGRDILSICI